MELEMIRTLTAKPALSVLASAALLAAMAMSSPALAMNNGAGGTSKSKGDLEAEGWTCVVVSVGFWSCTKPGEHEQWCDASSCQPAPLKGNKPKLPGQVIRNGNSIKLHG
jgi:hypothetical protein